MSKRQKVKIGIVIFFNYMEGFGIIKDIKNSQEFFVDFNGLINSIKKNDTVEFEVYKVNGKFWAIKVRVI